MDVLLCVQAAAAAVAERGPLLTVLAGVIGLGRTVECAAMSVVLMAVLLVQG